jgi:hypothetical protein
MDDPSPHVRSNLPPDGSVRPSRDLASTRHLLAVVVYLGFSVTAVLVIVGGLTGRFGPELVGCVVTATTASATAVVYHFFRRSSS